MLKVERIKEISDEQCVVIFDDQVPVSFRSRPSPVAGARHIRIGDFNTHLFDFQVPQDELVISGFTFLSGGHLSSALNRGEEKAYGLPILRFDEGIEFPNKGRISKIDISSNIYVSITETRLEVYFGIHYGYEKSIQAGRVEFLVSKGYLIGVAVSNLSEREIGIIHDRFGVVS
ncbi:hypothetical protein [Neorhizobium sp. NCHU2750]|uniref:hypothetical protein n=1 Tax=Neorhizobium sp. NCHU2750 TaxID=1825976 RepID=UPI000EB655E4|nr:hypothetical protein NCHU2750_59130 [Neorhizobium sp. NCHU2750]